MNILVIGGTRFFGIHMVNELLTAGYDVTIATRGKASDSFGDKVKRIFLERTKEESVREALSGTHYDVVIDKIAYCSNDIKYVMLYNVRVNSVRLIFIDEPFEKMSDHNIKLMLDFFKNQNFQVIFCAPPNKLESIGSECGVIIPVLKISNDNMQIGEIKFHEQ